VRPSRVPSRRAPGAAALLLLATAAAAGGAARAVAEVSGRVEPGDAVADAELRTLGGGKEHLLRPGVPANVVVFFRPGQERSLDALREVADCEKEFAQKPVRWVGVVSDAWPAEQVQALVRDAGVRMPVLVDAGDAVYGRLGVRLHPVILIVDGKGRLAAFEPFRQINFCERVRIRVKRLLGEATDADVARVDAPERSETHSDAGVARRHLNYARSLLRVKQYDRALEEVGKALAAAPSAAGHALRGRILAEQGDCAKAVEAFDAALKLDPADAEARDGRARCGR
jgi:tetratricopeptide (TPR) repeat protein